MAGNAMYKGKARAVFAVAQTVALSLTLMACTTATESSFEGPDYSDDTRKLEKQMMAEATALGTAQGVAGVAASMLPMGAGSLVTTTAGRAARDAMIIRHDKLMREQVERDTAEFYKRYGITDADAGPARADQSGDGPRRCARRGGVRRC